MHLLAVAVCLCSESHDAFTGCLKVTGYPCVHRAKCIGNVYLISLAVEVRCHKVQGMTEAFMDMLCSHAKQAVQFTKKPYLPLFSSETADKFARIIISIKASTMPCTL